MKKTNKSNPLKTFNDNKAMAYKKAGGEMKAFKKSLTKAQNGIAVDSVYKASQSMSPNPRTNVDTVNQDMMNKTSSASVRDNAKAKAKAEYLNMKTVRDQAIQKGVKSKPYTPNINYREEIQKRFGTGPDGNITPEDMMKLKAQGILKKGGLVKRKK